MRLVVKKTYKLYIDGQFPRTESGRHYAVRSPKGDVLIANACRASRKDVRNAVGAARKAFDGWSRRTTLNRGQILYRVAEFLEARGAEFTEELTKLGATSAAAKAELERAVDTWLYYAGWADKYAHLLGTVNPVAGPYYNFSVPEPMGVVGVVAPEESPLAGLAARIAPAIVAGNTTVVLTSESRPLPGIAFGEVLATSDVPPGVVNILSGYKAELAPHVASHMDVNALDVSGAPSQLRAKLEAAAAANCKRITGKEAPSGDDSLGSLWAIAELVETKTVWHPIGL